MVSIAHTKYDSRSNCNTQNYMYGKNRIHVIYCIAAANHKNECTLY